MKPVTESLHIGCGPTSKNGDVGIDILPGPAVDIVHDLNVRPWPLSDERFSTIICKDVLEHLTDVVGVMEEIHRIATDGALVLIHVPSGTSPDVFTDPTHLRGFSYRSFDYFDPEKSFYKYGYSQARFRVISYRFVGLGGRTFRLLDHATEWIANHFPTFYEFRMCHIMPVRSLEFTLCVQKSVR